jgi:predicted dehydrogenase
MNGAIIGFGKIAEGHLAAYRGIKNLSIVAVVDPVTARRDVASRKIPEARTYDHIEELFQKESLDFIDICSPPVFHNNYIRLGLSHQCHVLCEKPLVLSPNQLCGIMSLLRTSSCILYPGHNYKFSPGLKHLFQIANSDQIGDLSEGFFRTLRCGHARGVPEWQPDWRRNPNVAGGGILLDHGTHSIYLAYRICGTWPSSVSCLAGNFGQDGFFGTEDTVIMTVDFSGIRFRIDLSWGSGFRNSYYSLAGSQGVAALENNHLRHTNKEGKFVSTTLFSEFDDPSHQTWFRDMLFDFIDAIANPDRQGALISEAFVASLVVHCAYRSAQACGTWVTIPSISETCSKANGTHTSEVLS